MKNHGDLIRQPLPCYRGEMLLLKYLELRTMIPPTLASLADEFNEFVAPIDSVVPRPRERVLRYLGELETRRFARVVNPGEHKSKIVEITEVGLMSSRGIGLDASLRSQWEKQELRLGSGNTLG
jgi:hypothetical protein